MMSIRTAICAGAFSSALFCGSFAAADAVDDLLAGKPVVITKAAPGKPATPVPSNDEVLQRILEQRPLDEEDSQESVEVKLSEPSHAALEVTTASRDGVPATVSTTNLTLVPEPSAVALAVASLVYFLIFFRRRYSY